MCVAHRSVYPHGPIGTCCYLARDLVEGDGLKSATVIVVDGVQDRAGAREDREGVSRDVHNNPLAVPVPSRDSLKTSFWLAWKDPLHTIGAIGSCMALLSGWADNDNEEWEYQREKRVLRHGF